MKYLFLLLSVSFSIVGTSQVYNFGTDEVAFKNFMKHGLTYRKCGDDYMDSLMISHLEKYWTCTSFTVLEKMVKPGEEETLIFITEKEWMKKHMIDRKNQHVLVVLPAEGYRVHQQVTMESTLGYMYLNGFYDLVKEEDEHRFLYMAIKAINDGLSSIMSQALNGEPIELNEKVAEDIRGKEGPIVGNTLILNREQTRHVIQKEELDKLGIKYRLFAEEEYYEAIEKKDPSHLILYFAVNRFTEVALLRLSDGELLYSKHCRDAVKSIDKKTLKYIAEYFK